MSVGPCQNLTRAGALPHQLGKCGRVRLRGEVLVCVRSALLGVWCGAEAKLLAAFEAGCAQGLLGKLPPAAGANDERAWPAIFSNVGQRQC